jgi:hypothetical protein
MLITVGLRRSLGLAPGQYAVGVPAVGKRLANNYDRVAKP